MRIAVGLAAVAVVAGMILAGGMTASAARAATGEGAATAERTAAGKGTATAKTAAATAKPASVPVGVRSHYAELANAATGANLWSRSSAVERPMGSITKVMTAYVVLTTRGLNLKRVITVPSGIVAYDERFDASTAGLRPGEKLTTLQLLYAMMLPSGCDAAYTLASAYGPGLTEFVARMNAAARTLGLAKTHFTDPSGLPNPGPSSTYSTAHDLIALGRDAMKNKTFATIVATRGYKVASSATHLAHTWQNLDPLLGTVSGAIGIKTGFTSAAGQCLLFEAQRGSKTLIGVVLDSSGINSPSLAAAASDAVTMLDWGFSRLRERRAPAYANRKPMPSLRVTDRSHSVDAPMPSAMSVIVVMAQIGT
jgi:D-alanyl-D-alanine carboxypeptidase (penicillin-binding protein 5/6)